MAALSTTNRRFHFALLDACAQPRLVRILQLLWDATEVYRFVYFTDETNKDRVLARHRQNAIDALRPLLERSDVEWRAPDQGRGLAQLETLD